nr:putative ribonuclease H-like domain-containing protein [Tanacetum cinerariifolium]
KTINSARPVNTATPTYADYPNDPLMHDLEDVRIFDDAYDDKDKGAEADYNNLETGHRQEEGIDYDEVFVPVARIEAISVKSASTLMKTHKPLSKDAAGTDVDVHLYRSMIGSLMYLTSSKPNIMIDTKIHVDNESAICVVKNPVYHSKTKLEIRHHFIRDSYEKRLIEIVKIHTDYNDQTVNDNVRLQALIDGKKVVITEAFIRHDLKLNDAEGTSCLPNVVIFEELARMGAKTTSWNEFSSTMASAIICVPFYMFPRFVQVFVNHQIGDLSHHIGIFVNPSLTKKDPIPIPSSDPLLSSEDSMSLKELMVLCTNLSNKILGLENEVIEMKYSHKAKIAELESRVEKLEEENKSLTKELKSFNSKVDSLAYKKIVMDKEKSSKQGRKIADIDADAKVNLENVYNLDLAHEETVLSMHDATDADGKEVAKEVVEVITTAKLIVDEVSTVGDELNAIDKEQVSAAPTNITTAQPSEATKISVDISNAPKAKGIVFHDVEKSTTRTASLKAHVKDKGKAKLVEEPKVLKSRKAQVSIGKEVTRKIEAEWNADIQDNIDWNEVVEQVQSKQSDAVRKYQALKRNLVSVAQARKNMIIYLKNMAGFKMEFFKGMSYDEIRHLFKEEYNKVQTLFKEGLEINAEKIKAPRKRTRKENVEKDQNAKKSKRQMFNKVRLQVDYEVEMAYDLLRLIFMENIKFREGLLRNMDIYNLVMSFQLNAAGVD